jgi:hypothetical protein
MVDGSHHHVFASGGTADDAVAVLNLRGKGLDGTPRPARHSRQGCRGSVVGQVHGQGCHRRGEEHGPRAEMVVASSQVRTKGTEEVQHKAAGGKRAQYRHGVV